MSSSMNGDVMMEILVLLPAKSLVKFKSVSRSWYSLISSNNFHRLHTLRHRKPPPPSVLILQLTTSNLYYLDPLVKNQNHLKLYTFKFNNNPSPSPNPNPNPKPRIMSSCNGLMLLRSHGFYYVHNPTTRQSRNIVIPNLEEVMGLCLAFDPSESIHYKIVCVVKSTDPSSSGSGSGSDEYCAVVEVYNSESGAWEQRSETFTAPARADFSGGVYCNHCIHWRGRETGLVYRFGLYYNILQNVVGNLPLLRLDADFDLSSATATATTVTMSMPCHLQHLNAHLNYVLKVCDSAGRKFLAVYELRQDYSRWYLKNLCRFDSYFYTSGMHNLVTGNDGETAILLDLAPGKITAHPLPFGSAASQELVHYAHQLLHSRNNFLVYQFGETFAPV